MSANTKKEEWRPVSEEGYEHYLISSEGRVRNSRRKKDAMSADSKNGYPFVTLSSEGVRKGFYVHRLVAKSFLLNQPTGKLHVNHKNGVKTDNSVGNLEWCTPEENAKHAWENGLVVPVSIKHSKFREESFLKPIHDRLLEGDTLTSLATEYSVDVSSLSTYLKDLYGREYVEGIYKSEAHGKISSERIRLFYSLILEGWTIQRISKEFNVSEDVRDRLYADFGREHVTAILKKNTDRLMDFRRTLDMKREEDLIREFLELLKGGKTFSDIGKVHGVSHKTVRKKLNFHFGSEYVDEIRFNSKVK